MKFKALIILLFLCSSLKAENILVVHLDKKFQGASRVATEASNLIKQYDDVVILKSSQEDWRTNSVLNTDVKPKAAIYSGSGDHDLVNVHREITLIGGYFRACFSNAVMFTLYNNDQKLKLTMPMKAIFFSDDKSLYEEYKDNYKTDEEFLSYINEIARTQWRLKQGTFSLKIESDSVVLQEN